MDPKKIYPPKQKPMVFQVFSTPYIKRTGRLSHLASLDWSHPLKLPEDPYAPASVGFSVVASEGVFLDPILVVVDPGMEVYGYILCII